MGNHGHELLPVGGPALDFGDDEFSLVLEDPPGLSDEVEVVGAHEGKAEHAQADRGVLQGQFGDVSRVDEGLRAH